MRGPMVSMLARARSILPTDSLHQKSKNAQSWLAARRWLVDPTQAPSNRLTRNHTSGRKLLVGKFNVHGAIARGLNRFVVVAAGFLASRTTKELLPTRNINPSAHQLNRAWCLEQCLQFGLTCNNMPSYSLIPKSSPLAVIPITGMLVALQLSPLAPLDSTLSIMLPPPLVPALGSNFRRAAAPP